jgi:DNA-binding CsgD family transcriptional regulator
MEDTPEQMRVSLAELEGWQKTELEQEILKDRSEGRSVQETIDRLGIGRRQYHSLMSRSSRRAGKHITDTMAVYLTNLIHRLDRATHVVSQQVESGDMRAANTFANLVKSSADIIAVVYPKSMAEASGGAPSGDLVMIAARMGLSVPQPLLGNDEGQPG